MKRILIRTLGIFIFLGSLAACQESELGTGVANPPAGSGPTTTNKAAALVASLFSSDSEGQSLVKRVTRYQESSDGTDGFSPDQCVDDPQCTCAYANSEDAPSQIVNYLSYDAGTYGSASYSMTVGADEFCQSPDGAENPGLGPDGRGRFVGFELTGGVPGNCDEGTSFTMSAGSSGIYRNTDETDDEPSYHPQIFGTFNFDIDGESVTVDCTIFMAEDEEVLFADCSDETGVSVIQDTDVRCEFNAE